MKICANTVVYLNLFEIILFNSPGTYEYMRRLYLVFEYIQSKLLRILYASHAENK